MRLLRHLIDLTVGGLPVVLPGVIEVDEEACLLGAHCSRGRDEVAVESDDSARVSEDSARPLRLARLLLVLLAPCRGSCLCSHLPPQPLGCSASENDTAKMTCSGSESLAKAQSFEGDSATTVGCVRMSTTSSGPKYWEVTGGSSINVASIYAKSEYCSRLRK